MKKVTKSREFDSLKENQPIKSGYDKSKKHSLIKTFTQSANHNVGIGKSDPGKELDIEKAKKEEYVEKPAEDIKQAKGKFVKVKKSFGKIEEIEKGGPKKFPSERTEADIPKKEQRVAKGEDECECENEKEDEKEDENEKEEKSSCKKYKSMVNHIKDKAFNEGLSDSEMIKSLNEIDPSTVSDSEFIMFEKAYTSSDAKALAEWVYNKKEDKKEKSLNSSRGSGGDLIAPQLAGSKKGKYVKVKKSLGLGAKSFFVRPDCQGK